MRIVLILVDGGRRRAAVASLVAILALATSAGCGRSGAADDGRLTVAASFYPLAEAAARVGGSLVDVTNLTPPGVEPHDLELAPDDLEALLTADVVVYVGGGFQPAVEDAVGDVEGRAIDVLEGLDVRPPPEGEQAEGDGATVDPHVWLDPIRYAEIVRRLAGVLAEVDPDGADAFRANARALVGDLEALDREYRQGLADCERRTMVVNHAAFGYLADAYGLEQVAISGISPESEIDPSRLAELEELVRRRGVTTIFTEELASPDMAETLAAEAGVRTARLNPIEGLTRRELDAGEDYRSTMRRNLRTMEEGLGCA